MTAVPIQIRHTLHIPPLTMVLGGCCMSNALVIALLIAISGCTVERCADSHDDEIVVFLLQDISERAGELGIKVYITIEGTDPSEKLVADLRNVGIDAKNGSEYNSNEMLHFTYEVLEVLENCDRRIEYAFRCNGMCSSSGTETFSKTSTGWESLGGRVRMN